jgi:hypothetical protein
MLNRNPPAGTKNFLPFIQPNSAASALESN